MCLGQLLFTSCVEAQAKISGMACVRSPPRSIFLPSAAGLRWQGSNGRDQNVLASQLIKVIPGSTWQPLQTHSLETTNNCHSFPITCSFLTCWLNFMMHNPKIQTHKNTDIGKDYVQNGYTVRSYRISQGVCVCVCVCVCVWVCAQLPPTLRDPMQCSLPNSSVHGIFQPKILEWVAILYFRGSSLPRGWTWLSCVSYDGRQILHHWATWEAYITGNYMQYPGINYNGKECKKGCIHVYNWVTLLYSRN